ncbi:hypothetical protein HY478_02760 [Candidatus Uhrbacteria bacterium]|nr:hypothetical protein [Candidatus Uhrbacteria bacterium]
MRSVVGGISEFFVSTFQPFAERQSPRDIDLEIQEEAAGELRRKSINVLAVDTGVAADVLVPAGSGKEVSLPSDTEESIEALPATSEPSESGATFDEPAPFDEPSFQGQGTSSTGILFAPAPIPLSLFIDPGGPEFTVTEGEERPQIAELPGVFAKIITKAIGTSFSAIAEAILGGLKSIFPWF